MKMDVVKLLELEERFVRWVVVVGRRGDRTYVNSPTREAALYEASGAARDWGVLRMRLAGGASEDVGARPRFLTAPVPWDSGPDAGFSGCEGDAAWVGEAERDELGEADSAEEISTLPFLAALLDSTSSASESSIGSLGGDCGRLGGALVAVEAIGAVSDGVAFGAVLDGLFLRAVGSFLVAVDATGTASDDVALGAVGGLSVVTDATRTVSDNVALKAVGGFSVDVDAIGIVLDGSFFEAVGAFLVAVGSFGASLESLALGAVGAFLVALDAFGAPLGSLTLGAVGAFLVAVVSFGASFDGPTLRVNAFLVAADAFGAALDGIGLALKGNFVDESSPREPGREPADAGDETPSSASGLFIVIVASFSLGSLDDPGETGPSVPPLKITDGGAADAALIGDFSGPTGDDIWWLLSV